jgi:hypothetical protein
MPKPTSTSLAARLTELEISPEELAALVKRPAEDVTRWIKDGPDEDAAVLLRFLAADDDALRRVDQLRRTHTRDLRGDGMSYAGIDPGELQPEPVKDGVVR